jgi:hypothetical protein
MRTLLISSLAFFLASGTVFASPLDPSQVQMDHGPAVMSAGSVSGEMHTNTNTGTAMPMGDHMMVHSSSTVMASSAHPEIRKVVKAVLHGVPGIVTGVSTNAFTMVLPSNNEHTSTTITVTVTSTTKFMQGSTTAAFSNVAVGSRVEVFGKVSTSTRTIAAERILIVPASKMMNSEKVSGEREGIMSHIKNILMGKHGSSTSDRPEHMGSNSDSAAAIEGTGFFGTIFHAFLNLF